MQFKLVDSIQWMDEREEHVLRQLRLISQKCEFYLLYISSCCRNYRVATVTKDWLLDTICSHEIKPVAGELTMQCQSAYIIITIRRVYSAIDGF